jgi:hypothetical protein
VIARSAFLESFNDSPSEAWMDDDDMDTAPIGPTGEPEEGPGEDDD